MWPFNHWVCAITGTVELVIIICAFFTMSNTFHIIRSRLIHCSYKILIRAALSKVLLRHESVIESLRVTTLRKWRCFCWVYFATVCISANLHSQTNSHLAVFWRWRGFQCQIRGSGVVSWSGIWSSHRRQGSTGSMERSSSVAVVTLWSDAVERWFGEAFGPAQLKTTSQILLHTYTAPAAAPYQSTSGAHTACQRLNFIYISCIFIIMMRKIRIIIFSPVWTTPWWQRHPRAPAHSHPFLSTPSPGQSERGLAQWRPEALWRWGTAPWGCVPPPRVLPQAGSSGCSCGEGEEDRSGSQSSPPAGGSRPPLYGWSAHHKPLRHRAPRPPNYLPRCSGRRSRRCKRVRRKSSAYNVLKKVKGTGHICKPKTTIQSR